MDDTQASSTRRLLLGGIGAGLAGAALSATTPPARAQGDRKTFVLVHGASAGGWCYRRVADRLEQRGHKVFTPTLTGLGERSHLMSGMITLDTHIADVVNVIRWENLDSVVLVGHSYGGWIVSGVAEKVEKQISSIVFLDAFMPENGQRVLDTNSPRSRAEIEEALKRAEVSRPPPHPSVWKVNEKDAGLGAGEIHGAADRRCLHTDPIDGRARPRAEEDLCPGDWLRQSQFREGLCQSEGRSVLAHVRNAVRPRGHDRHAGAYR